MAIKDRSARTQLDPRALCRLLDFACHLLRSLSLPHRHRASGAACRIRGGEPCHHRRDIGGASALLGAVALSEQQAEALIQASEAKDKEIGELRAAVQDLSGQVTALSSRLKPLERVLGPVAALPSSTSVTTSPPSPEPNTPIARPPELPKPSVSAAPPTPPSVTVDEPSDERKPTVQAKPIEKPAEKPVAAAPKPASPAPEEDDASAAPSGEAAAEARPGDPSPPEEDGGDTPGPATADDPDAKPDSGSTETAALTPPRFHSARHHALRHRDRQRRQAGGDQAAVAWPSHQPRSARRRTSAPPRHGARQEMAADRRPLLQRRRSGAGLRPVQESGHAVRGDGLRGRRVLARARLR